MVYAMWVYFRDVDEAARQFMIKRDDERALRALSYFRRLGLAELFLDALPKPPRFLRLARSSWHVPVCLPAFVQRGEWGVP